MIRLSTMLKLYVEPEAVAAALNVDCIFSIEVNDITSFMKYTDVAVSSRVIELARRALTAVLSEVVHEYKSACDAISELISMSGDEIALRFQELSMLIRKAACIECILAEPLIKVSYYRGDGIEAVIASIERMGDPITIVLLSGSENAVKHGTEVLKKFREKYPLRWRLGASCLRIYGSEFDGHVYRVFRRRRRR